MKYTMSVAETLKGYDESNVKEDNNDLEMEFQSQWSNLDQRMTPEVLCSWLLVKVDDKEVKGWGEGRNSSEEGWRGSSICVVL